MKIKNIEVINSINAINKILQAELKIKTQFKLNKNIQELNKIVEIYNNSKEVLIKKYADKDKNGELKVTDNMYTFNDNAEEFNKELNELNEIENNIAIEQIDIDELGDIKLNNIEFNTIVFLIK